MVNGKAWIHFLVLMTTFGQVFGTALAKVLRAAQPFFWLAGRAHVGCVCPTFAPCSPERSGRALNQIFGLALVGVAVYLA